MRIDVDTPYNAFTAVYGVKSASFRSVLYRIIGRRITDRIVPYYVRLRSFFNPSATQDLDPIGYTLSCDKFRWDPARYP
jgi:hypothetical protein